MSPKKIYAFVRSLSVFLILVLTMAFLIPDCYAEDIDEKASKRIINVVYDDSGSMVKSGGTYVERWSQAKYAMEVFCAMMSDSDEMNIYPMSQAGKKGLTLMGSDKNRVSKVHAMNAEYDSTPFSTVTSAAKELMDAENAYEKWLVIITDGEFDDGQTSKGKVQSTLDSYNDKGIKTVYLAIGDKAVELEENTSKGAFAEKAADGSQVLSKVTDIANQIFEHQVLTSNHIKSSANTYDLDIDIPTTQLVVFAQGDNVSVGTAKLNSKEIKPSSEEQVKYSDVVPSNFPEAVCDNSLKGVVVTYDSGKKPFESGEFSIDIQNTDPDKVEFYYSPGVTVNCELLYNGTAVQERDSLYAGDYKVSLNFVNPLTGKSVASDLLSQAKLTMEADNNGKELTVDQSSGNVTLGKGEITIEAIAEFPGNVFLRNSRQYKVLPKPIEMELSFDQDSLTYTPDQLGDKAPPVTMTATNKETGEVISEKEWKATKIIIGDAGGVTWKVALGDKTGTWKLTPYSSDGTIKNVEAGTQKFDVSADYQLDDQYGNGTAALPVKLGSYEGSELRITIAEPKETYSLKELDHEDGLLVTVEAKNAYTGEFEPLSDELSQKLKLKAESDKKVGWSLTPGSETSTWILQPEYYHGDILRTASGEVNVTITGEGKIGELIYSGQGSQKAEFEKLDWHDMLIILLPRIIAFCAILWLIIGYVKKKRLRIHKLDPRCRFKRDVSTRRRIKKDFLSIILPYVPEKATVYCHNTNYNCNFPDLKITATGKRSFKITNSVDVRRTLICMEKFETLDEMHARRFTFGSFEITSLDPRTGKAMGTFSFHS